MHDFSVCFRVAPASFCPELTAQMLCLRSGKWCPGPGAHSLNSTGEGGEAGRQENGADQQREKEG